MAKHIILAGGYSSSIIALEFDDVALSLKVLSESLTGENPSWIASHPRYKEVLYVGCEVDEGTLQSYVVAADGALTGPIDQINANGSPAHVLPLLTGEIAVMNYTGGNGRVIPTTPDPLHFAQDALTITFDPPTEGVSHPHQAFEVNGEVLVPDLGGDKVWRLSRVGWPGEWKVQGFIETPKGSGPRHIQVYENNLFILNEINSTLSVQPLPSSPSGTSSVTASFSITPPNPPPNSVFGAAEILLPAPNRSFPTPYVYVSNRNIGAKDPRGDSIVIFRVTGTPARHSGGGSVDGGAGALGLELVRHVYTGLEHLRGMEFGGEDERWLVAAGAWNGGVAVLRRTEGGANLEVVSRSEAVEKRTTFVWL